MESTSNVYTTSMRRYYKNIIDTEFKWLQFLASFGKISKSKDNRAVDLEIEFGKVRCSALEGLDEFLSDKNVNSLHNGENLKLMQIYICRWLREYGLDEAIGYVRESLGNDQMSDFMTLLYVRNSVKSITDKLWSIRENIKGIDDDHVRMIYVLIDKVAFLLPDAYVKSEFVSEGLMDEFCGEMGIRYSILGSGNAYIFMVLSLLDRINSYLCYLLPAEYQSEIKPVSHYLNKFLNQTYLTVGGNYSLESITTAFEGLKNNIEVFNRALNASKVMEPGAKKVLAQQ